ncbi:MAG: hypothetical protein H8E66_02230 [Planctomycetes bacterium]|nr:hypothetical protein [Planctomycetota bacterium]
MSFAEQVDVFYGRVTHSSAQVYARVSSLVGGGDWSITGQIRGPVAPGTRTLPTTIELADLGEGATLLASCSIPDPTFWTTQLPATYDVEVQLHREGELVETVSRSLAIRAFGASGRNFLWDSKRWVLRGVSAPVKEFEGLDAFKDNAGVLVAQSPPESLLRDASLAGVLLVVELSPDDLIAELQRLSLWPAVAIVILPHDYEVNAELRASAPNLLFAARVDPRSTPQPAKWLDVIICDASDVERFHDTTKQWLLPLVAERRLNGDYTLIEARRECDHLQRDLVPHGDFAGYVVHCGATSRADDRAASQGSSPR